MANTRAIISRLGGERAGGIQAGDTLAETYSQPDENKAVSEEEAEQVCADLSPALLASLQAAAMPKKKITK